MATTQKSTILLGLLGLLVSCATAVNTRFLPQEEQWEKARLLWQSNKIQKYAFEYDKIGTPDAPNTVYPWYVTVEAGKTPTAKDGNHNQINWATPKTMNQFFHGIKEELDQNTARVIDVQYNSKQGYPENIYIVSANGQVYDVEIGNLKDATVVATPATSFRQQSRFQELYEAEALWETRDIEDYQFQYRELGSNPNNIRWPVSITVRDEDQVSGKDANGNQILWKTPKLQSVEDLFDRVRDAFNKKAKFVEVRYNKVYGYPEDMYIVYDDRTPDATFDAEVSGFVIN